MNFSSGRRETNELDNIEYNDSVVIWSIVLIFESMKLKDLKFRGKMEEVMESYQEAWRNEKSRISSPSLFCSIFL